MNLFTSQLNALTILLPRMRISRVMAASTWSYIPFDTLMSIRTAGMKTKIASGEMSEYEFVQQWANEVVKPKALEAINKAKPIMSDIIKKNKDANVNEIMTALEKNFLNADPKKSQKDAEEYMKEKGFSTIDQKNGSDYVSLFNIKAGNYDGWFAKVIGKLASKVMTFGAFGDSYQEAMAIAMTAVTTGSPGSTPSEDEDVVKRQKKKIEKKGFAFERHMNKLIGEEKITGASLFIQAMKTIGDKAIINMTAKGVQKRKKDNEKNVVYNVGGETDIGDIAPEEFGEAQLHHKKDPTSSLDKEVNQDFSDLSAEQKSKQIEKQREKIKKSLPGFIRNHVPKKTNENGDRVQNQERIQKTIFAFTFVLEHSLEDAKDARDARYYNKYKEEMNDAGINSLEEYRSLFQGNIWERVSEDVADLVGWEEPIPEEKERSKRRKEKAKQQEEEYAAWKKQEKEKKTVKAAGATLSHQLLKTAAAKGKINMLGMICAIEPRNRQAGNVMVFERGRPKFAHIFNWDLHKGKIRIADIQDIDADHLDDAYQVAFEAIQQEVAMNNMEEQMVQ